MKTFIYCLFINFILAGYIFPQGGLINYAEILIKNGTNHQVLVKVFPVGAVFSGNYRSATTDTNSVRKYSLEISNPYSIPPPHWPDENYITGGGKLIQSNDYGVLDFDDGQYYNVQGANDKVIGGVSYGLWKLEFYYSTDTPYVDQIAECYIDYRDFNHGTDLDFSIDIYFDLIRRPNSSIDSLLFHFASGDTVNIFDNRISNKIIKSWHKVGVHDAHGTDPIILGSPQKGLFKDQHNLEIILSMPLNTVQ